MQRRGPDSRDSEQEVMADCCEYGNEHSGFIKQGEFLTGWRSS